MARAPATQQRTAPAALRPPAVLQPGKLLSAPARHHLEYARDALIEDRKLDLQKRCTGPDFLNAWHPQGLERGCASRYVLDPNSHFRQVLRDRLHQVQEHPESQFVATELRIALPAMIVAESDVRPEVADAQVAADFQQVFGTPTGVPPVSLTWQPRPVGPVGPEGAPPPSDPDVAPPSRPLQPPGPGPSPTPTEPPPKRGLSTTAKVGLGVGALVLGGLAIYALTQD